MIVLVHFEYCSETWSSVSKTSLERLECLYDKATKPSSNEKREISQHNLDKNLVVLNSRYFNDLAQSNLQANSPKHQKREDHTEIIAYMLNVSETDVAV